MGENYCGNWQMAPDNINIVVDVITAASLFELSLGLPAPVFLKTSSSSTALSCGCFYGNTRVLRRLTGRKDLL